MSETILWVIMGLLVAFNIGHFMTLRRCEGALMALTMESKALTEWDPSSLSSDLKEEVGEIVADVIASMRPPSIADHLGGAIAQFAQLKMMKALQADEGLLGAVGQSIGDGSEFNSHMDD